MPDCHHLLIDGYNVIYQWPELRRFLEQDIDIACERLGERVRIIHDIDGVPTTIVFDGRGEKRELIHPTGENTFTFLYAPASSSADAVIEQYVNRVRDPENITVVSHDNMVRETVSAIGAHAITPKMLADWILGCEQKQAAQINRKRDMVEQKWTLGAFLDDLLR